MFGIARLNTIAKEISSGAVATIDWYNVFTSGTPILNPMNSYIVNNNIYNATNTGSLYSIAKFNNSGTIQWQKSVTMTTNTLDQQLIVDSSENVYIIGSTSLAGGQGSNDIVLIKLNSSGTEVWQRGLGNASSNTVKSLCFDSSGNILVAIQTGAIITIANYSSTGTLNSQINYTVTNAATTCLLTTDSSGNIYAGIKEFNSGGYFITVKFNSAGTIQWQKRVTAAADNGNIKGISLDSSQNVYIGITKSTDFSVIIKYNSSGVRQYTKQLTHPTAGSSLRIDNFKIDSSDKLLISVSSSSGNIPYFYKCNLDFTSVTLSTSLTRSAGLNYNRINYDTNNVYISSYDAGTDQSLLFKLPITGTKTGTYGSYVYSSTGNITVSDNTEYTEDTPAYSKTTGSLVSYTRALTISTTAYSSTTTSIP